MAKKKKRKDWWKPGFASEDDAIAAVGPKRVRRIVESNTSVFSSLFGWHKPARKLTRPKAGW